VKGVRFIPYWTHVLKAMAVFKRLNKKCTLGTAFAFFVWTLVTPAMADETLWPTCQETVAYNGDKNSYQQYYQSFSRGLGRRYCMKDWAVLIYMAADNDLTPYAYADLYEMEFQTQGGHLATTSESVDVLVELDTLERSGVSRLHMFQSGKPGGPGLNLDFFAQQTVGDLFSPVVKWFPETGPGSLRNAKQRFKEFLRWSVQNYPAKNYTVIIWGHGEGHLGATFQNPELFPPRPLVAGEKISSNYLDQNSIYLDLIDLIPPSKFPGSSQKPFGGVAFDHSDNTFLDTNSIKRSLKELAGHRALKANPGQFLSASFNPGPKTELVVFDACLMQSLEVASELSAVAHYMVGAEQVQNYLGLPYRRVFDFLNTPSSQSVPSAYQLAKALPDLVRQSYDFGGEQWALNPAMARTFTTSTLQLSEMRYYLLPALVDFSEKMMAFLTEDFIHPMELSFILDQSASFRGEGRDLGVFLGTVEKLLFQMEKQNNLSDIALELRQSTRSSFEALNRSLVNRAVGDAYINPNADENQSYLLGYMRGVSVWLPSNNDLYSAREQEMEKSLLFQYRNTTGTVEKPITWQTWIKSLMVPIE